jgi:undecaprenyl-diphosphatase
MNFSEIIVSADFDLFLFLNGMHNRIFDWFMFYISYKYTWIPMYLFVLVLLFKKYKLRLGFIIFVFFIFLIFLSDQTSVHLFKNVFQRYRPCHHPDLYGMVHYLSLPGSKFGFVSSHAVNASAFAFLSIKLLNNKIYTYLIIFWVVLICYSRIYLGVHFPGDVIIGAGWGLFMGILVWGILKKIINSKTS